MYVLENPVLQRELLVNLRTQRSFLLLLWYQVALAAVVLFAWPEERRLDLTENPQSARKLVDLFFLGQFVIASLIAPSFAAGAITGEKERGTYEMLLASPLRPSAIVLGKLIAALTHLGVLIVASLPIIVVCLPLGGISVYEVVAAYLALIVAVLLFGSIGVASSSYFRRTTASLAVSYLVIMFLVLAGVLSWSALSNQTELRLQLTVFVVPAYGVAASVVLCGNAAGRLLYPPDVGNEGKEVVDLEAESQTAIGLVIQRDQWPDRMFAPPKKTQLMDDGINPIYDKEIHSEIFSQGTLMLRLVIQLSMFMAIPLMAWFLFAQPHLCTWYMVFVLVFNLLIGPVFLSGSMTSERERQTLDLLLTTTITPNQILWGKLIVGLRISLVLTSFLLLPLLLAGALVGDFWSNWFSLLMMLIITVTACITNSVVAMFCSVFHRKSSISLINTYLILLTLYAVPIAIGLLLSIIDFDQATLQTVRNWSSSSPFTALFALPLDEQLSSDQQTPVRIGNHRLVFQYFVFTLLLNVTLMWTMTWRLGSWGVLPATTA